MAVRLGVGSTHVCNKHFTPKAIGVYNGFYSFRLKGHLGIWTMSYSNIIMSRKQMIGIDRSVIPIPWIKYVCNQSAVSHLIAPLSSLLNNDTRLTIEPQVSRAGTSNYIPHFLCDVITWPFLDTCFWHNNPGFIWWEITGGLWLVEIDIAETDVLY